MIEALQEGRLRRALRDLTQPTHPLPLYTCKQVAEALREGRVAPDLPAEPLKDVRTGQVVSARPACRMVICRVSHCRAFAVLPAQLGAWQHGQPALGAIWC